MRRSEFFHETTPELGQPTPPDEFNIEVLAQLLAGPLPDHSDVEAALALALLLHEELEKYGTSGGEVLSNTELRDGLRTLRAVIHRIGAADFDPPFRDFNSFRDHWKRSGAAGSYDARRNMLDELFGPLETQLDELDTKSLRSVLAEPISPHSKLGWPSVDDEIAELRRHFAAAHTPQDYRGVGNDCIHVTEALSRLLYDPAVHLREGETEPPVANTKQRLERYVEHSLGGSDNAALRKLLRSAIEFAQQVKHSSTPTRTDAGVAADAVLLLANILRRLSDGV